MSSYRTFICDLCGGSQREGSVHWSAQISGPITFSCKAHIGIQREYAWEHVCFDCGRKMEIALLAAVEARKPTGARDGKGE